MKKARVAVFVSGGGTNLQALLDAKKEGLMPHASIELVFSDKAGAFALERAAKAGVPTLTLEKKNFPSQAEFEKEILASLKEKGIDLIVLAGFLCILSEEFVKAYPDRIINVHPSLIPSFCGKGFYGLKVHEFALARGVKLTGATVHLVNEIPDGGEILMQKAVEVREGDTPEILQRRVMEEAEWILLPRSCEMLAKRICKG